MATTFGVIQRNLRENHQVGDKRGITQDDLLDLLKQRGVRVTQGYLSKIEKTKTEPRRDYVRAICEIFNIHPLYVLGMASSPSPLTASTEVESSSAFTPEGKQVGQLTDSLPSDLRKTLVVIARVFTVASETDKAKAELDHSWEMQWNLIEKIGGVALRARIEKELGISDGNGYHSIGLIGGDKLSEIFKQFIGDSNA